MRRKWLALALSLTMVAGCLTGCGGDEGSTSNSGSTDTKQEAQVDTVSDDGKVFNIRVWNDEFKTRLEDYLDGYKKIDETTGEVDGIKVKWTITPSKDNAYQDKLDEALLKQKDAAADDKVDLFLVEADYALKYVDTEYTIDVNKTVGLTEDQLSQQYKYTKDIVTDGNGVLKGVSWQGCPGAMIYRRDIAKKVFGSDDPAKVQENFADWAKFNESAAKLKEAGYQVTASANDTYRVYSNNVSSKWVEDGKINIDANIKAWVDASKELVDAKETKTYDLWSPEWQEGFQTKSNVFCYFGPAWFIDFSMGADTKGTVANAGGYAATTGPQGFFWGGTWICGANGTDNISLVKKIMTTLTTDADVMTKIVKEKNDFVNNKGAMEALANDKKFANKVLGGQNPIGMFCEGVEKVDLSNLTSYDQTCTEEFQLAMKDYFEGKTSYDDAIASFYKKVETKHPELKH